MMQIEERAFPAKDIYTECIQLLTDLQVQDDPFFDKITKLFDPSNIDGSFQSNLPTDSEGKMLLDETEAAFIYKSEKLRTFSESSRLLAKEPELRPAEISSRLVEFRMPPSA